MDAKRCGGLLAALLLVAGGCRDENGERKIKTTTEMASEKMDESKCRGIPAFLDMSDNAILQDMSLADIHFVAHTSEISGTGAARLDRMAALLETYGGKVHYETYEDDAALVQQRLAHVTEYISLTGCNMSRVQVEATMSDGRTFPATEAIAIADKGTSKSQEKSTDPGGAPLAATPSP